MEVFTGIGIILSEPYGSVSRRWYMAAVRPSREAYWTGSAF